jgi:hypothetical protein
MSAKLKPTEPKSLRDAGLENYLIEEMHRERLTAAKYNPRQISDSEKAKLKAAIKRHGFVAPIVWNKRTGNLVGGHQRISIMDQLMDSQDYTLSVSVIDVDEKREKEINVLLNNSHAMGSFDMDMLKSVFDDAKVSVAGAGYSQSDMMQLFGSSVFDNRSADLEEFSATLSKIAQQYDAIKAKNLRKANTEHFLVFVFPSGDHVAKFLADNSLEDNRYQNGLDLMEKLSGTASAS